MTRNPNFRDAFFRPPHTVAIGKENRSLAPTARRRQYEKAVLVVAVVAVAIWAVIIPHACQGADWKTGEPLRRELASRGSVTWKGLPLRDALTSISAAHDIAIVLDRRVDPTQEVDFSARNVPLNQMLSGFADILNLGVAQVGDSVYIGPPDAAARITAIIEARVGEIRKLTAAKQRTLLASHPVSYQRLATPNEIAASIAQSHSLRVVGDPLPHDLWPAGDFPAMNVAESLTLTTIGFGKTFEFSPDGSAIRWIDLPAAEPISRKYAVTGAGKKQLEEFVAKLNGATAESVAGGLMVKGDWQVHAAIAKAMQKDSSQPSGDGDTVYSLNVENQPAAAVLGAIANQAGFTIKIAPQANEMTRQRVSFAVKDASLSELLHAILDPVNLKFRVEDKVIQISPKS